MPKFEKPLIIKYVGDGSNFLNGVPARDLTEVEFKSMDNVQRAAVRDSPLYDYQGYKDERDALVTMTSSERDNAPQVSAELEMESRQNSQNQTTNKGNDKPSEDPPKK